MLSISIPEVSSRFSLKDYLIEESNQRAEIMKGLFSEPKYIPSHFFYDALGSKLFEQITLLPEYYLSRAEMSILQSMAPSFSRNLRNINVIELGSGNCSKISILFDPVPALHLPGLRYVPVDINEKTIIESASILFAKYPGISINGFKADFLKDLHFLKELSGRRLICFFGSTLGNLSRKNALSLLLKLKMQMSVGDQLLIGLDLVKDESVLHRAYNDSQGITAAFNKNILNVVNKQLLSNFSIGDFMHHPFYNEQFRRIEMHLKAKRDLSIESPFFDYPLMIKRNETILTENCHKYTLADIEAFGEYAGFQIADVFTGPSKAFALVHYTYS